MFAADLQKHGPQAKMEDPATPVEAAGYCRRLAREHYENFSVATRLLPRALRQHFCNIYAYCRWADDLADEIDNAQTSLSLLDWWEGQLHQCYSGNARHPVFVALRDTIETFDIPAEPFANLLVALRQDQRASRYETFDELLQYCRYSANPVGRLVLYLGRCCTDELTPLSDSICTGLQLANFWQDVARDHTIGRVYLPIADCHKFGYEQADLDNRVCNDAFRRLLAAKVDQAQQYLRAGLPLVDMVPRALRLDVALFIAGGLAILQAVRGQDYDVWTSRPVVSKWKKLSLAATCWWRLKRGVPVQ